MASVVASALSSSNPAQVYIGVSAPGFFSHQNFGEKSGQEPTLFPLLYKSHPSPLLIVNRPFIMGRLGFGRQRRLAGGVGGPVRCKQSRNR